MRKYTLTLVFCLIIGLTYAQSTKTEYYDLYTKTKIMAKYQVDASGQKHGWFIGYDKQGVVIKEYNYKNNQLNGLCIDYTTVYGSREVMNKKTYKDGVLNGEYIDYARGGLVIKKGNFLNGERHGDWFLADPYTNYDLTDSEKKGSEYVGTNGRYDNGRAIPFTIESGIHKEYFYPSKKLRAQTNFKNSKRFGKCTWYYPTGAIEIEQEYDQDGELIYTLMLYPDGKTRTYNGLKNGEQVFEDYDKNGNPTQRMKNWANEQILVEYDRQAMEAFEDGRYKEAAQFFIKANNPGDAALMYSMVDAESYFNDGNYIAAIRKIQEVRQKVQHEIIEGFYEKVYVKFLPSIEEQLNMAESSQDYRRLFDYIIKLGRGGAYKASDYSWLSSQFYTSYISFLETKFKTLYDVNGRYAAMTFLSEEYEFFQHWITDYEDLYSQVKSLRVD